jgi:hypothetical protein
MVVGPAFTIETAVVIKTTAEIVFLEELCGKWSRIGGWELM